MPPSPQQPAGSGPSGEMQATQEARSPPPAQLTPASTPYDPLLRCVEDQSRSPFRLMWVEAGATGYDTTFTFQVSRAKRRALGPATASDGPQHNRRGTPLHRFLWPEGRCSRHQHVAYAPLQLWRVTPSSTMEPDGIPHPGDCSNMAAQRLMLQVCAVHVR